MTLKVTTHLSPYGVQSKDCETIEDAFAFIAANKDIISVATITRKRKREAQR